MIQNILKQIDKPKRILLCATLFTFVVSVIFYLAFYPGKRVVLLFESMDSNSLAIEHRYIPSDVVQGEIAYFVDELLLGPVSNRSKPLFANNTRAISCFLTEDNVLYINLNEKALFSGNSSSETLIACDLLKKNVLKNYKYVDTVEVFIMGNMVTQN